MKNIILVFYYLIVITQNAISQECNCSESFNWMVSTFEKNDAGFQYVIDKKGIEDYKKHTELFKEKVKGVTTLNECQSIMYDWLLYFRPGHLSVYIKESGDNKEPGNNTKEPSAKEIRQKYKDEKKLDLTEKQLINIIEKKKKKNPIEGVWSNDDYIIGIISDEKTTNNFTGFIIKADSIYWMPKQIKVEFTLNDDNKTYSTNYYMRNHSKVTSQSVFANDSCTFLIINGNYWIRKYPENVLTKKEQLNILVSKATLPFVEKLSDKTIYLRIPSFIFEQKKSIDSVLAKNDSLIKSTSNLIIDIRNGTGGSDESYSNLIPYLYTNPIRTLGVQLYATELNAKGYENYAKQFSDTADINDCKRTATKMRANLGKFITMSDQIYDIDSSYKVLKFPNKVAIICNQNNGSTDEQFLLDAKQSNKVKVFGRPTRGHLDISNMNIIDFPDGKFVLGYCMSKSFRIPKYCIDGIGIQPDYFIDDAINDEDWIEYTKTVLEK